MRDAYHSVAAQCFVIKALTHRAHYPQERLGKDSAPLGGGHRRDQLYLAWHA